MIPPIVVLQPLSHILIAIHRCATEPSRGTFGVHNRITVHGIPLANPVALAAWRDTPYTTAVYNWSRAAYISARSGVAAEEPIHLPVTIFPEGMESTDRSTGRQWCKRVLHAPRLRAASGSNNSRTGRTEGHSGHRRPAHFFRSGDTSSNNRPPGGETPPGNGGVLYLRHGSTRHHTRNLVAAKTLPSCNDCAVKYNRSCTSAIKG